jgi:protein gp37
MGDTTKIEWTQHTFNPWIGCEKVSQECKHCYAEAWARRYLKNEVVWGGKNATRHQTTDAYWNKPLRWNKEAAEKGRREFVFCASLADWAEDRPELVVLREKLFGLIDRTPNLIWQLLTKRYDHSLKILFNLAGDDLLPSNIILGFTCGTKETVDNVANAIFKAKRDHYYHKGIKLFLSCEPLLEDVAVLMDQMFCNVKVPDAVIVGGESGNDARPMHPSWAKAIRDLCSRFNVPFMFKQWGEWAPTFGDKPGSIWIGKEGFKQDHKPRMFNSYGREVCQMAKVGKKEAGRKLDGQYYDGMPKI